MEYRSLGRTGVKVSALCLGCLMFGTRARAMESIFGDEIGEAESMRIIDRAIDAGINFLDTANVYRRGTSEEIVGKALKRNGHRSRVVLSTKFTASVSDDPNARGGSRRHIIEQCDASLRRLRTDWIDLYQVHDPQSDVPIDETLRALDDLIRAGKVRYIGSSNFAAWQVVESLWVGERAGSEPIRQRATAVPPAGSKPGAGTGADGPNIRIGAAALVAIGEWVPKWKISARFAFAGRLQTLSEKRMGPHVSLPTPVSQLWTSLLG